MLNDADCVCSSFVINRFTGDGVLGVKSSVGDSEFEGDGEPPYLRFFRKCFTGEGVPGVKF